MSNTNNRPSITNKQKLELISLILSNYERELRDYLFAISYSIEDLDDQYVLQNELKIKALEEKTLDKIINVITYGEIDDEEIDDEEIDDEEIDDEEIDDEYEVKKLGDTVRIIFRKDDDDFRELLKLFLGDNDE